MSDAAVAQMVEQPRRNGQVVGSTPTGGSDATVVLRLVGAATLVGHRVKGDAKLYSCLGGYGPVAGTASEAADLLLDHRPVRIPVNWEGVVRSVLAMRALNGDGPQEAPRIWDGRELKGEE